MNGSSAVVVGFVKFPVDDPSYRDTREGGMYVRLVVRERAGRSHSTFACHGGSNYYNRDGKLLYENKAPDALAEYRPEAVPAVITLGSTSWSGWSDEKKEYFRCDYEDLAVEGKVLHKVLAVLFPHCDVVIQTW